jgi:RNA polymerase sigma-70 factor (ECF subfamily)
LETSTIDIHKQYIERCKKGDHQAFNQLYKLYAKAMYNVALRIIKDQDEAEDILQEAFVKAYHKIKQFEYQATFGAWLKRIVINQALDTIRKQKAIVINSEDHFEEVPEEDNKDWELIELTVEKVRHAIESLPTGFRLVSSMFLFEGYEHKEIAEVLGISESTSKSQLHRAKLKIKELMIGYER